MPKRPWLPRGLRPSTLEELQADIRKKEAYSEALKASIASLGGPWEVTFTYSVQVPRATSADEAIAEAISDIGIDTDKIIKYSRTQAIPQYHPK